MFQIKTFPFNPFQVNTYVLYDETGECVIVDAACYGEQEERVLQAFIEDNALRPVALITTHAHIDHILGNNFVYKAFGLKPLMHKDGLSFLENAVEYGTTFGFTVEQPVAPENFLAKGDTVKFGNQQLQVLEAPGHAAGSICLYHAAEKFVIVGDVLFQNSIGRTDLPTGDFDTLINAIHENLMVLDNDTVVYCGHGPATTIGHEKQTNPYL